MAIHWTENIIFNFCCHIWYTYGGNYSIDNDKKNNNSNDISCYLINDILEGSREMTSNNVSQNSVYTYVLRTEALIMVLDLLKVFFFFKRGMVPAPFPTFPLTSVFLCWLSVYITPSPPHSPFHFTSTHAIIYVYYYRVISDSFFAYTYFYQPFIVIVKLHVFSHTRFCQGQQ